MNKRLGVIDLGSNTFHLLIVEVSGQQIVSEIARKRNFVGLGDGGIDVLKPESIKKGIEALKEFKDLLTLHSCSEFRIIGTAALRTAVNSVDFIEPAEELMGKKMTIIDGLLEADYIFRGIRLLTDMSEGISIIMDIGGGSTEFIIVEQNQQIWSKSYKLGVGVLHSEWHKTEPIGDVTRKALLSHLADVLNEVKSLVDRFGVRPKLIGASGSFEVLESMTGLKVSTDSNQVVTIKDTMNIIEKVVNVDFETRRGIEGLPHERTKLIVVGLLLIESAIQLFDPLFIEVCPYALKEGVLAEMIESPAIQ